MSLPINKRQDSRFIVIDFETATGYKDSACSVAIVTVEAGVIVEEYSKLIQPPENYYWKRFSEEIHHISASDTANAPTFDLIFPEIEKRLAGMTIVAHSEGFDRGVLGACMDRYGLESEHLDVNTPWECTVRKYHELGYYPASLDVLCEEFGIPLDHHQALSDARGCALLYQRWMEHHG